MDAKQTELRTSTDRSDESANDAHLRLPADGDFRHLADHLPSLCWIADSNGWIYWFNRRWHEYCGTTPQDMHGWGWQKVLHPDVFSEVEKKWSECIENGVPFQMVFPLRGADGLYRPFLTKADPMRGEAGHVCRWFGMNTDISELQDKDRQLLEVHEQLEMALDSGAIRGTWVWDIVNDRFKGDARFSRTFSIDADLLRDGIPLSQAKQSIHPEDIPAVEQAIKVALDEGASYSAEYRVLDTDGEYRWIEANGRCEQDAAGNPVRFPGVIIDIHRRKLAEERQRLAVAEAEEAGRLLATVIDAMPALIFKKDRQGCIDIANAGVLDLLGKSWSEIKGKPDDHYLDPEFADQIKAHDRQVMATGQPLEVEELAGYRNGRPRVWLSRKSPFYNADGEIDGIIGTSIEITDRKDAEDVRRLMIRELNHRIKNLFAMTMSLIRVTSRTTHDSGDLSDKLIARLRSLSDAHSLILPPMDGEVSDVSIDFSSLLRTLLAPYEQEHVITLEGPEVPVPSSRVSELALIWHELATNAAKYGALSVPMGQLFVQWAVNEGFLCVSWTEAGGPAVVRSGYAGFGSQLVDSLVKSNLQGEISRNWSDTNLTITLKLQLGGL